MTVQGRGRAPNADYGAGSCGVPASTRKDRSGAVRFDDEDARVACLRCGETPISS